MKIQIEQKDLSKLISKVARAAATASTVPVLQGIILEAAGGKLVAQATDMEIGVKLNTPDVQVHDEGKILVHAKNLDTFVKNLPEGVVTLEVADNKLLVKYGRSKANLNLISEGEYPAPPECKDEILTIGGLELRKSLERVLPAVAKNHFRQVFMGVLLDIQADKTVFVGSDTHRLNVFGVAVGGSPQQIIIPAKTADELLRLIEDEEVLVLSNGNNLIFKAGEKEITSRLIDGIYPNYVQVIPSAPPVTEMTIATTELKHSLQRLMSLPIGSNKISVTKLSLNGLCEISSTSSDAGEIKEHLEAEKVGEDLDICFNSSYLMDAIKLMPEETKIGFLGKVSPAVLKGEDGFLSVLVPLRENS